ncbi:MAG: Trk system potassium transporter TrkA [Peptoniphilaceae bacterium]|uniref:Trk system potassium transporter TrkA n=1 Tax=Parvimonas sp. TaxID=1944660 RepID=UPI0025D26EEE|nr:Trk system potassium transporter TrkA [Parvimonas sp.]MCI5996749.1 Trk system potassium transporter TrkA [Parvimonas sp.]MDD7764866.1 Trk system potassium transporter TrkA [Peptoniphilaceae bacterium]MDY3050127.1 Trk system potassium transporter TrkA [Parvimonas sp.]
MKIVIVGAGKVGEYLFTDLNTDENDIILIEKRQEILNEMLSKYDIMGVSGNATSYDVLDEASVSDSDVFIAVTESDEINIISCIFAKKMGAKYTIARVRNPEYSDKYGFIKETLGIDLMINPEFVSAREISRSLKYPSAHSVETFADGRVKLVGISVDGKNPLNNLKISDLQQVFNHKILIGIVQRGEEIFIPSGNFVIRENDKVYFTGADEYVYKFYNQIGVNDKNVDSVFIIGGSRISYYLISNLIRENINIKLIEVNRERAEFFSEKFPQDVKIICADGSDSDVLDEEGMSGYDSCIALTGIDEENIMLSMYAKKLNVKKTIAKVSRLSLLNIISSAENYSFVTPKKLVSDIIISVVRSIMNSEGANIETLHRLCDNKVEAVEIKIKKETKAIGKALKDLNIKENVLIAYIIRDGKLIFPTGDDSILVGDSVIVISKANLVQNIDCILV